MEEIFERYEDEGIRHLVVLVTTRDKEEALRIAEVLVSEKLCACANIVDSVTSVFTWKGSLERASECLMIIKSQLDVFTEMMNRIKEIHSYDVPEIIALPILSGNPSYLKWIDEVTGSSLMD